MNDLGTYRLKTLEAINSSRLWLTSMTLGYDLQALDAVNNSRLLMT